MNKKLKKILSIFTCSLVLVTTSNLAMYSEIFADDGAEEDIPPVLVPVDDRDEEIAPESLEENVVVHNEDAEEGAAIAVERAANSGDVPVGVVNGEVAVPEGDGDVAAQPVTINLVIPFSHDGYKFPTKTVTLNAGEKLSSNEDARAYIEDFRRISYYQNVRPKTWKDQEDHILTNAELLEKPQDKDATYTIYESERKLIYTFNYIDGREKERRPADYASYKIPTQGTIKNTELNKYVKINFIEQKGNTLQNAKFDQFEHFHAQLIGEAIVEHNKPGKFNEFYEWVARNENNTDLDDQMRIRDFLGTVSMSGTNGGYANFHWRMTFRTILKISDASKENPKEVHYKTVFTDYNKDGAVVTKRDFDVTLNSTSTRLRLKGRNKVFDGQNSSIYPDLMALQTSEGYGSNNPLVLGKRSLDFEWPEDLKTNYKLVVSGSHEMGDFVDKIYSFYRRVKMTVDNGDNDTNEYTVYQGLKVSEGDNLEGLSQPAPQEGKIFLGWKLDEKTRFTSLEALKNFVVKSATDFTVHAQYEIDKTKLIAKIQEGKTLLDDSDTYTPSTIAKLQETITAGETEKDSDASTVETVNTAIANIDEAITNLKRKANLEKLKTLVDEVDDLDESIYTPDSYSKLAEPLNTAKEILTNPEIDQNSVDRAYDELKKAKDGLKPKADKSTLNKLIEEAESKTDKDYLPNSLKDLPTAIEEARKVAQNDNASKEDVERAVNKLQEELNKLVPRPDKTELEKLIETAKEKEADKYTEDSFKELQEALENAEKVNKDDNADSDKVTEAKDKLKNALEKLVEEVKTSIPDTYPVADPLPVFPIDEVPNDENKEEDIKFSIPTTYPVADPLPAFPIDKVPADENKEESSTTSTSSATTSSTSFKTEETTNQLSDATSKTDESIKDSSKLDDKSKSKDIKKGKKTEKKALAKTGENISISILLVLSIMSIILVLRSNLKKDELV